MQNLCLVPLLIGMNLLVALAHAVHCQTDAHSSCWSTERTEAGGKILGGGSIPPGLRRYSVRVQDSQRLADTRCIQVCVDQPLSAHNSSLVSQRVDICTAPILSLTADLDQCYRCCAEHQRSLTYLLNYFLIGAIVADSVVRKCWGSRHPGRLPHTLRFLRIMKVNQTSFARLGYIFQPRETCDFGTSTCSRDEPEISLPLSADSVHCAPAIQEMLCAVYLYLYIHPHRYV